MIQGKVELSQEEADTLAVLLTRTTIGILPMSDRVIVEQFVEDQVSKGGIILPDQSQEKPAMGTVVAIGEGKLVSEGGYRIPCPYQLGHVVIFGKYSGTKFVKAFSIPNPKVGTEETIDDVLHFYHVFDASDENPEKCRCGNHERDFDHVSPMAEQKREFLIMREDEIMGIELERFA